MMRPLSDAARGTFANGLYRDLLPLENALRFDASIRFATRQPLLRTQGEKVAARAAQGYPLGRCRPCATNISEKLSAAGEGYTKILVEPPVPFDELMRSFEQGGVARDLALSEINSARNGMIGNWHEAILKDRYIFDNLNPDGVLPLNWINDLSSKGRRYRCLVSVKVDWVGRGWFPGFLKR
jgi:hypothetical protein